MEIAVALRIRDELGTAAPTLREGLNEISMSYEGEPKNSLEKSFSVALRDLDVIHSLKISTSRTRRTTEKARGEGF
jgi:hypothetical protein